MDMIPTATQSQHYENSVMDMIPTATQSQHYENSVMDMVLRDSSMH